MGIGDHGILAVGKGRENVAKEMVAAMVDEDSEVISIYYGAETTEEDAEASGLRSRGKYGRTADLLLHYVPRGVFCEQSSQKTRELSLRSKRYFLCLSQEGSFFCASRSALLVTE